MLFAGLRLRDLTSRGSSWTKRPTLLWYVPRLWLVAKLPATAGPDTWNKWNFGADMFAISQPYFIENTKDPSNIKRAVITIAGARRKYVPHCLPKLLPVIVEYILTSLLTQWVAILQW